MENHPTSAAFDVLVTIYRWVKNPSAETLEKVSTAFVSANIPDESDQYTEELIDAVTGLYWYCADFHTGQSSDEYAMLSLLGTLYKPGLTESSDDLNDLQRTWYNMPQIAKYESILDG